MVSKGSKYLFPTRSVLRCTSRISTVPKGSKYLFPKRSVLRRAILIAVMKAVAIAVRIDGSAYRTANLVLFIPTYSKTSMTSKPPPPFCFLSALCSVSVTMSYIRKGSEKDKVGGQAKRCLEEDPRPPSV